MRLALLALSLAATAPAGAANLLTNGSFEDDFNGWTMSPSVDSIVRSDGPGIFPTDGQFHAQLGNATLSQTIATVAGREYTIRYDLASYVGSFAFSSLFGSTLLETRGFEISSTPYQSRTFTAVATGPSTTLSYNFQNFGLYYLDNVSVTANVPEPGTWAMLIAGFGAIGAAARRRRAAITA